MISFTPYYEKLGVKTIDELKSKILEDPNGVLDIVLAMKPKQLPIGMYEIKWCDVCGFKGMIYTRQNLCPICIKKLDNKNSDSVDQKFNKNIANWQDTKNLLIRVKDSPLKEQLLIKTFEEFLQLTPKQEFDAMGRLLTRLEYKELLKKNILEEEQEEYLGLVEDFSNIDQPFREKVQAQIGRNIQIVDDAIYG